MTHKIKKLNKGKEVRYEVTKKFNISVNKNLKGPEKEKTQNEKYPKNTLLPKMNKNNKTHPKKLNGIKNQKKDMALIKIASGMDTSFSTPFLNTPLTPCL